MRRMMRLFVIAGLLALTPVPSIPSQVSPGGWQTGQLLSVEINGQGRDAAAKNRAPAVWWTYCICAQKCTYYAVLRLSPENAGLTMDTRVKFRTDQNQLYLLNSNGERHVLRIVRQDKQNTCR